MFRPPTSSTCDLLRDVFAECKRVLEPGGRIAVNVANLGRRPYRSLSGDVTEVLQELGLLLRGEVIWWKGRAAGGSCAWGTFQRPGNPVLRDVTERIVIASKGRFDRALSPSERQQRDLPSTATIARDKFMEATTDLWEIPPESATKVGHPAPFPVELPSRLIELYTYEGDLVLGSLHGFGKRRRCRPADPQAFHRIRYRQGLRGRGEGEDCRRGRSRRCPAGDDRRAVPGGASGRRRTNPPPAISSTRAVREGRTAKDLAAGLLAECGFTDIRPDLKLRGLGISLSFVATDQAGGEWAFEVSGSFTSTRAGLRRADTLWRSLGKAAVFRESGRGLPLVLLTTDAPVKGTAAYQALDVMRGSARPVFDLIELLNAEDRSRLAGYAVDGRSWVKD